MSNKYVKSFIEYEDKTKKKFNPKEFPWFYFDLETFNIDRVVRYGSCIYRLKFQVNLIEI